MNLTALSFTIQFIHSFRYIPTERMRERERETAQSKGTVIENFLFRVVFAAIIVTV
jgi:hypothetical protein